MITPSAHSGADLHASVLRSSTLLSPKPEAEIRINERLSLSLQKFGLRISISSD